MVQRRQQRLYWQFRQHRLWQCGMYVWFSFNCKRLHLPAMAREPDAIKKTELQIPAARGMFAPHLKCLHLFTCWLGIISHGTSTGNVCPATLVECVSNWTYMIPIVFAARAISPQMICTIPNCHFTNLDLVIRFSSIPHVSWVVLTSLRGHNLVLRGQRFRKFDL